MALIRLNNQSISSVTALPSAVQGLPMVDMWRMNTNTAHNSGTQVLSSNWERADAYNYGNIGSAMTQSSGVFTFPETGIYFCNSSIIFEADASQTYIEVRMQTSTDSGSSFSTSCQAWGGTHNTNSSTNEYTTINNSFVFDVQNASTYRIRLQTNNAISSNILADTNIQRTGIIFIKLGNT